MKKRKDDWLIVFVGGPLFGGLVHWKFADSPGLAYAVAVGFVVMSLIVLLRRVVGDQSWPGYLTVTFLAGVMIGLAVWWLIGYDHPWLFYALPCGLFVLVAGVFDRLTERRRGKTNRTLSF